MKTRAQLLMLVALLGGLGALWYADHSGVPTADQRRARAGRVLTELIGVDARRIHRVDIDGLRPIELARADGGWRLVRPLDAVADRRRVEAFLANLQDLSPSPESGASAIKHGKVGQPFTVRLFDEAGRSLASMGVGEAVGDRRRVDAVGSTEALVDARALNILDDPADAWRERGLFDLAPAEVDSLAIDGPGLGFAARRVEGRWRVERPIRAPGDTAKLDALVAALVALRAVDGPAGLPATDAADLSPYGFVPPTATIRLGAPGRREQVIEVGATLADAGRTFARREGQDDVLALSARGVPTLAFDPSSMRDPRVFALEPERVRTVRITAGGLTHLLARDDTGWSVIAPIPGPADRRTVAALLDTLADLRALEFLDPSTADASGLSTPSATVEVWEQGGPSAVDGPAPAAKFALRLGRVEGRSGKLYARAEGDPTVLALPAAVQAVLVPEGPLALRDRVMLSQDRTGFRSLRLTRPSLDVTLEASLEAPADLAAWRITRPLDAPTEPEAVGRLVVLLSGLRAESLVAESGAESAEYGLDFPPLVVAWRTVEGAGRLRVGGPVPKRLGARYAAIDGRPTVFTLGAAAAEILGAEPRARRVWRFDPSQAQRLTLRWPNGRQVVATRRSNAPAAEAWSAEGDAIDGTRLAGLVAALAELRTGRYAQHVGPFDPALGLDRPAVEIEVELTGPTRPLRLRLGGKRGLERPATVDVGPQGAVFSLPDEGWGTWAEPPSGGTTLPKDVFKR